LKNAPVSFATFTHAGLTTSYRTKSLYIVFCEGKVMRYIVM